MFFFDSLPSVPEFHFILFRFEVYASFSVHLIFSHQSEKNFASLLLRSKNYGSFLLPFCIISLPSEKDGSFSLLFLFISLRSKNDGNFLLLFHFIFASFHFRFASDFYVSHRCEKSEKSTFVHIEAKTKICLRFALFCFEAKMTAHPNCSGP